MSCHVSFFFMNCYFHHLQILNSFLKINLLIVVVLKLQLVILRCVVGGLFFELNFNCVHFLLFLFCSCFALVRFDLFRCVLLVSCLFLTNSVVISMREACAPPSLCAIQRHAVNWFVPATFALHSFIIMSQERTR